MSDEEREAKLELNRYIYGKNLSKDEIVDYLGIIFGLIEKQSKEIEELKEDRDKFKKALGKRITYCNELEKDLFENCSNYVVSKDKIKAKVEDILNSENSEAIEKLIEWQSLLEKE